MQFLGQVFEYVLGKRGATLNILGATSGDTGSAAEYALRGKRGVSVFMLSPHGRMSAFQRAQMYSLQDENIHNIAVRGVFDQAQDIVKALAGDLDFKTRYRLGAVNSINWARIAAQVVYYFHGWLRATSKAGDQVSFAVPSGNFGNILSGHIARSMGLPVRRLVLATNENNVLEEFFRTGVYRPRPAEQTYATSSPSMDISRASNFERFVFDLVGRDPARVQALGRPGARRFVRPVGAQVRVRIALRLRVGRQHHADRLATIRSVYDESGVLVDPHTADGVRSRASSSSRACRCWCWKPPCRPSSPRPSRKRWAVRPRRRAIWRTWNRCRSASRSWTATRRRAALPRGPRQDVMPDPAGPVMAACGMCPENPPGASREGFSGGSPGESQGNAAVPGRLTGITFVCIFATSRHRLGVFGTVE